MVRFSIDIHSTIHKGPHNLQVFIAAAEGGQVNSILALISKAALGVDGMTILIGDALPDTPHLSLVACFQELLLLLLHGIQVFLPNTLQKSLNLRQFGHLAQ